MSRDDFKSYDLIAIHAGGVCGLGVPTVPQAAKIDRGALNAFCGVVADSPEARKLRDKLYADFERRLRDPGYSGDHVHAWFEKTYGPIGRVSIFRVRAALRANESRIAEISEQAAAFMAAASESGADGVFEAASQRAGQLYFQLLMQLSAEDLMAARTDPKKVVEIINSLARLQKSRAEADLLTRRVDEIQRKLDAEKAKADESAREVLTDKGVDLDTINRIRSIYGLPKAQELVA